LRFLTGDGSTPGSGLGQYAIGIFSATDTTATFKLVGNESSQLNAFQLRDITPAPPRITVARLGTNVTLSWPAAYTGWTLQVQTNAGSIGISANWLNVPGTAFANTNVITISPATPPAFYRLKEP